MTLWSCAKVGGAVVVLLVAIALSGMSIKPSRAHADGGSGLSAPIEGSWIFSITRINDLPASFTAAASFTAGGVFLATGSNDRLNSPGPVSPLYGSWKRTEDNLYISTTNFFAFRPDTGAAVAVLKAVQTFKLMSRDELVGVGEAWVCDVQGQNCQKAPIADISIKGSRIIPENVTELRLPQ